MIPAILVMGIGPVLSWGKQNNKKTFQQILISLFLTILFTIIFFLFYRGFSFYGLIGIFLSLWIICNVFVTIFLAIKKDNNKNNFFHGIMFHHFHDDGVHTEGQGSISKDDFYKMINFIGRNNILDADVFYEKFKNNNSKFIK